MMGATRTDRIKATPTELAQLERCETQVLLDAQYGRKRSTAWQRKAEDGTRAHAAIEAALTSPGTRTGMGLLLRALIRKILFGALGFALAVALILWAMTRLPGFIAAVLP